MLRTLIIITAICFCNINLQSQKLITKSGEIDINIDASLFSFIGHNKKVASIIDLETGEIVISTLIRSFAFKKAILEEQFNDNFVESEQFPSSVFIGRIVDYTSYDLSSDGRYNIIIEGKLNLHGVTKYIKEKASVTVTDNILSAEACFNLSADSYDIKFEKDYLNTIDDNIGITVNLLYKPYASN